MENLREYLRRDTTLIDTEEPPFGHFDRFRRKIDLEEHRISWMYFRSRQGSAIVILVLVIALPVLIFHFFNQKTGALGDISDDLKETEWYFETQLINKNKEMENLVKKGVVSYEEIRMDLTEMDYYYSLLQEDLKDNPNDERIVQAMINYYQKKVGLMDRVLTMTNEFGMNNNKNI